MLGLRCFMVFSLVEVSRGYSLVAVCGLLIAATSLVAEGLSCSVACEIFPDQELNLCLLPWQTDSLPLSHQGSLAPAFF